MHSLFQFVFNFHRSDVKILIDPSASSGTENVCLVVSLNLTNADGIKAVRSCKTNASKHLFWRVNIWLTKQREHIATFHFVASRQQNTNKLTEANWLDIDNKTIFRTV